MLQLHEQESKKNAALNLNANIYARLQRRRSLMIKSKAFYTLTRVLTVLFGLFLLFSPIFPLMLPTLAYDHLDTIPSKGKILLDSFPMILLGAFILAPNRLFLTKKLFYFRVSIFTILALFFGVRGVQGIYFFIFGDKHWMIIPASFIFILVGICFPLSIYAKKSQSETKF